MIRVLIPRSLFRYTGGQRQVEAEGESPAAFLEALDARYPGMRQRIADAQNRSRKSIRFFVNGEMAERPDRAPDCEDEVMIVAALGSG